MNYEHMIYPHTPVVKRGLEKDSNFFILADTKQESTGERHVWFVELIPGNYEEWFFHNHNDKKLILTFQSWK